MEVINPSISFILFFKNLDFILDCLVNNQLKTTCESTAILMNSKYILLYASKILGKHFKAKITPISSREGMLNSLGLLAGATLALANIKELLLSSSTP